MARKGGSWTEAKDGSLTENKPDDAPAKAASTGKKDTKKDKAKPEPSEKE